MSFWPLKRNEWNLKLWGPLDSFDKVLHTFTPYMSCPLLNLNEPRGWWSMVGLHGITTPYTSQHTVNAYMLSSSRIYICSNMYYPILSLPWPLILYTVHNHHLARDQLKTDLQSPSLLRRDPSSNLHLSNWTKIPTTQSGLRWLRWFRRSRLSSQKACLWQNEALQNFQMLNPNVIFISSQKIFFFFHSPFPESQALARNVRIPALLLLLICLRCDGSWVIHQSRCMFGLLFHVFCPSCTCTVQQVVCHQCVYPHFSVSWYTLQKRMPRIRRKKLGDWKKAFSFWACEPYRDYLHDSFGVRIQTLYLIMSRLGKSKTGSNQTTYGMNSDYTDYSYGWWLRSCTASYVQHTRRVAVLLVTPLISRLGKHERWERFQPCTIYISYCWSARTCKTSDVWNPWWVHYRPSPVS